MQVSRIHFVTTKSGLEKIVDVFSKHIEKKSCFMDKFVKHATMNVSTSGIVWLKMVSTNLPFKDLRQDIKLIENKLDPLEFTVLMEHSPDTTKKTVIGQMEVPVMVVQEFYQPTFPLNITEETISELIEFVLMNKPELKIIVQPKDNEENEVK